jgi:hypothetical protein
VIAAGAVVTRTTDSSPRGGSVGTTDVAATSLCRPGWHDVASPRIEDGALASVAGTAVMDVWAVGRVQRRDDYGDIVSTSPLIEHWDGKRWSVLASPVDEGALADVAATSARDAWAVGEDGTGNPLILRWDGARWSPLEKPNGLRDVRAIAAVSPRDVWIVGRRSDAAAIAHWDGRDWTTAATRREAFLTDVAAISDRDVWAVGSSDRALVMHWDGVRWKSLVRRPTNGHDDAWLSAASAAARNDVWLGGGEHLEEMSPPVMEPLLLHWDGRRLTYEKVPYTFMTEFTGLARISSRETWAVSENTENVDPPDSGVGIGVGSGVWHRTADRWTASELRGGRVLRDIVAVRTRRGSPVLWAVGEIGSTSVGYGGYFPEHTVPLVRRRGC